MGLQPTSTKNLRRFGFVHYVSRKMKYVVMYLNEEEYESKNKNRAVSLCSTS